MAEPTTKPFFTTHIIYITVEAETPGVQLRVLAEFYDTVLAKKKAALNLPDKPTDSYLKNFRKDMEKYLCSANPLKPKKFGENDCSIEFLDLIKTS